MSIDYKKLIEQRLVQDMDINEGAVTIYADWDKNQEHCFISAEGVREGDSEKKPVEYSILINGHKEHLRFLTSADDKRGVSIEALLGAIMHRLCYFQSHDGMQHHLNQEALCNITQAYSVLRKRDRRQRELRAQKNGDQK